MMKKIFSKCFMVAAIVVAMGFVSSCKDYNDEMMAEYRGQDASLKAQIEELTQKHNQDLAAAKDERDRIEDELNDHIADAEAKYATKAELEAAKADLEIVKADLETAKADLEAAYKAADATLKTELQTEINTINGELTTVKGELSTINSELSTINGEIETLKGLINTNVTDLATVTATVTTMEGQVAKLVGLDEKVATLEEDLKEVATKEELNNYVTQEQLQALKDIVDGLTSCGCDLSKFATLTDLAALESKVEADSIRIDVLENTIEQLKETIKCDSLASALTALQEEHAEEIAAIQDDMATLYEQIKLNAELAKAYTDDAIDALKDYVVPAINGIEGLLNEVRLDVKDLEKVVEELKEQVKKNTEDIETLMDDIKGVKEEVEDLKDALQSRISSVNIQGAYSPVLGYFNMPMGIKSNIVAAYYGEFTTGVTEMNFPFAYSESMHDKKENYLQSLKASLGFDGITIDEFKDGNAGKIYMTINPTEVDLTNVEFALVNSLGENAPVELTVQPSNDKLTFGYTRAGGATLYEAVATITDIEATDVEFNVSDYKDIFNDLRNAINVDWNASDCKEIFNDLKNRGSINLSLILEALYGTFNEISDAHAISAAWTDAMGESHTVLSNFDIAAVSVKPLSFGFLQDVEYINSKLQPVLVVKESNDFVSLSQSADRPVEVAEEITLMPTTYTCELLAPAYKKYVAVTAVNGSTDNLAAINEQVSEDFNKVLNGDVREINFKGVSGNTYEITYSALDYSGIVVNTKYYVTVK